MNFINELNSSQQEAVINTEGPSLVIAGAGSGKTRVLTYRIAQLLSQGVPAYKILALTFTNKAAREMQKRIAELVGQEIAANLWMGTFHSIFSKILRFEAEKLGYTSSYTIYDTQDSKNMIKAIVKDMKLDDKIYKPSTILGRISMAEKQPDRRSELCPIFPHFIRRYSRQTPVIGRNLQTIPAALQTIGYYGFRRSFVANQYPVP